MFSEIILLISSISNLFSPLTTYTALIKKSGSFVSISNELTNIDHWKEFHMNGQLKSIGFMTTSVHTHIGEWKYYSASGKLDSIVDYDKKYKVSFCEFYQIAKEKGLTGKTSSISFDTERRKWRIEKWNYSEGSASAIAIELQVDSMKIEEIELMGIY